MYFIIIIIIITIIIIIIIVFILILIPFGHLDVGGYFLSMPKGCYQ